MPPISDPPRPLDGEVARLAEQDVRVLLALLLDSQRLIVPAAERLMAAEERRELAKAAAFGAVAKGIEALLRSRWTAPTVCLLMAAGTLAGLHAMGVTAGDIAAITDSAAAAWNGCPP